MEARHTARKPCRPRSLSGASANKDGRSCVKCSRPNWYIYIYMHTLMYTFSAQHAMIGLLVGWLVESHSRTDPWQGTDGKVALIST